MGVERDVDGDASIEGDGGEVLVEEGFEEDDLVAVLEEGDEDGVLAWMGKGGRGGPNRLREGTNLRWRRW